MAKPAKSPGGDPWAASGAPVPAAFIALTALLCGALVMFIEVLGARVIGPLFGVSLFVWTSLITVTLVALAAGYAAGGILADRHPDPRVLYGLILAAGVMAAAVPFLKVAVLKACVPLGLRVGSLVAASVLFGPPLLLLGCVSPYVVRLALRDASRLGRTVGVLYALSTFGSFVGTLAAGFFLVGYVGVDRMFLIAGVVLVLLAAAYFVFYGRKPYVIAMLAVPWLLYPGAPPQVKRMADGTTAQLVHAHDGFYGSVRVIEYRHGAKRTRELVIDGLIQGGVDPGTGDSVYEYAYLLSWLPRAYHPKGTDALVIGLGLGAVPNWLAGRGIRTEVVEIDPGVVSVARRHFALAHSVEVIEADARAFLASSTKQYDYLVMDAYTGDSTPAHLLSAEAVALMRARLKPGGIAAFNVHGSLGPDSRMTRAILRTIRTAFPDLRLYPVNLRTQEGIGNIVIIAGERLPAQPDLGFVPGERLHAMAEAEVRRALAQPVELPALEGALILTDDYNPIDFLDMAVKESVRRNIIQSTDWDLLLGRV